MDEDPNWLYCIKSNSKLLPSFYEAIAVAFLQGSGGANSLSVVIDTICKERGTISDDGEAWVDKYSGALIKKIEHVTEEGFDDAGFRLVTRDIIEADLGEGVLNVAKPVGAGAAKAGGEAGLHGMSILENACFERRENIFRRIKKYSFRRSCFLLCVISEFRFSV